MKILMVSSDTAVIRGIQGAFYNTLKSFHTYWDRIDIICPHVKNIKKDRVFNNVFFHPLARNKFLAPSYVFIHGQKICQKNKPSLIVAHAYGLQLMSLGAWLLARKMNIPLIIEVHHIEGYPKASSIIDYIQKCITILFIKSIKKTVLAFRIVNKAELYPLLRSLKISADKIKILYSVYLDNKTFYQTPNTQKKYDVIFVGRLVTNKGLPLLLDSYQIIKNKIPDIKMIIIGRGPLENWLRKKIKDYPNIKYIPKTNTQFELTKIYNQSKIILCTSWAEGGPRVTVEAMACGLPVVSTPVGLMKEIIIDHKNGFITKNWQANQIAEKVITLLKSPVLYKQCSKNAMLTANRFSYEKIIANYALTYQKLARL